MFLSFEFQDQNLKRYRTKGKKHDINRLNYIFVFIDAKQSRPGKDSDLNRAMTDDRQQTSEYIITD